MIYTLEWEGRKNFYLHRIIDFVFIATGMIAVKYRGKDETTT